MTFADLHELLRLELLRRIEAGQLTGTRLAQQTGFRQAHISNFLNRKRALSLEGLDRVLEAQRLTIDQIVPLALESSAASATSGRAPAPSSHAAPPGETHRGVFEESRGIDAPPRGSITRRGSSRSAQTGTSDQWIAPGYQARSQSLGRLTASAVTTLEDLPAEEAIFNVPLVSPSVAMSHPRIAPAAVLESFPIYAARLLDRNPRIASLRYLWQRFVAIRVDAQQASAMTPLLTAGSAAVLDRHATSPIASTHSAEPALFAVRSGTALLLRLVELDDDRLILRPVSSGTPVQLIPVSQENPPADYLVGRIIMLLTTL